MGVCYHYRPPAPHDFGNPICERIWPGFWELRVKLVVDALQHPTAMLVIRASNNRFEKAVLGR